MSRINLLTVGMTGVDMKSNPLFIAQAKKLASATNMQFVEGCLKTRPGISYRNLGVSGKFQGEATFRPARGISAAAFSDDVLFHVVVVGGVAYSGCKPISGPVFRNAGDVHIYQAENYLIFQSPNTPTYWWDGETFTESPGLNEQDWNDPDMPRVEINTVAPVAELPECDRFGCNAFLGLTIAVRYSNTEGPAPGGHQCDAAVYRVTGNDVLIGIANLNNNNDGGDRETILTVTEEQAAAIAVAAEGTSIINLALTCAPDDPAYDPDAGWGTTCHTSLAWVIVTTSTGTEVYNGAPVGFFVSVDVNP